MLEYLAYQSFRRLISQLSVLLLQASCLVLISLKMPQLWWIPPNKLLYQTRVDCPARLDYLSVGEITNQIPPNSSCILYIVGCISMNYHLPIHVIDVASLIPSIGKCMVNVNKQYQHCFVSKPLVILKNNNHCSVYHWNNVHWLFKAPIYVATVVFHDLSQCFTDKNRPKPRPKPGPSPIPPAATPSRGSTRASRPCLKTAPEPSSCQKLGGIMNWWPIGSMYGIYANIGGIFMVNVTIYGIHGSYGWIF